MQRRGIVRKLAGVEIGTQRDKEAGRLVPVAEGGKVQRRGLGKAATRQRVDEIGACITLG
jgi:hypothetical protein